MPGGMQDALHGVLYHVLFGHAKIGSVRHVQQTFMPALACQRSVLAALSARSLSLSDRQKPHA